MATYVTQTQNENANPDFKRQIMTAFSYLQLQTVLQSTSFYMYKSSLTQTARRMSRPQKVDDSFQNGYCSAAFWAGSFQLNSCQQCMSVSPHPDQQPVLSNSLHFFPIWWLFQMLLVVLISIYLITSKVEHFDICLLAVCLFGFLRIACSYPLPTFILGHFYIDL